MSNRLFVVVVSAVLLGCAGLLGSAGWSLASQPPLPELHQDRDQELQGAGAQPSAGVQPSRDLQRHLPLAGMPGAAANDPDACRRLEGYVVDAVHELREQDQSPPFAPEQLKTAIDSGRCGVDSPVVAEILGQLGTAYARAGLKVTAPMRSAD